MIEQLLRLDALRPGRFRRLILKGKGALLL
jgi:hypothetical protein